MKKKWIMPLLAVTALLCMAGCGKEAEETTWVGPTPRELGRPYNDELFWPNQGKSGYNEFGERIIGQNPADLETEKTFH